MNISNFVFILLYGWPENYLVITLALIMLRAPIPHKRVALYSLFVAILVFSVRALMPFGFHTAFGVSVNYMFLIYQGIKPVKGLITILLVAFMIGIIEITVDRLLIIPLFNPDFETINVIEKVLLLWPSIIILLAIVVIARRVMYRYDAE